MGRTNLHMFWSRLENETRLVKEAHYTLGNRLFDRVVVVGIWSPGLKREEVHDSGLEIHRIPIGSQSYRQSWWFQKLGMLRKIVSAYSLARVWVSYAVFARQLRPKYISCHNVALLPLAWLIALTYKARLVYLPHELEAERSGLGTFGKRMSYLIEKFFVHRAKAVVLVCDPIAEWYKKHYKITNTHVIRNVPLADMCSIRPVPEGNFRTRFSVPDTALITIYQGGFGALRNTGGLLRLFSELDPARHHLVLMGYGSPEDETEVNIYCKRFPNIHFQKAVAPEWIVSYTAGADFGIFAVPQPTLSYRYSLPNKFYEYAHAGLPVLVSDNLVYLSSVMRGRDMGWSVSFDNIKQTLQGLNRNDVKIMGSNAKQYARTALWDIDAQAFNTIYRKD